MPGMKEKESSKKGFACAMAYTEEPTRAKFRQRMASAGSLILVFGVGCKVGVRKARDLMGFR